MNGAERSLWPLRVLAVLIAAALWLNYSYGRRDETVSERAFSDVTLTYSLPPGLVLLNPPSGVSVRLSGPQEAIRDLSPFQVSVSVSVPARTGLQEIELDEQRVTRPPGFDVVSVTPVRLSLQIDREVEKDLRVLIVRGTSEPPAGAVFKQAESRVEPASIRVRGPESLLSTRDTINAVIDLDNRISSHTQQVTVQPIHELVRPVGPSIVTVFVAIQEPKLPSGSGSS